MYNFIFDEQDSLQAVYQDNKLYYLYRQRIIDYWFYKALSILSSDLCMAYTNNEIYDSDIKNADILYNSHKKMIIHYLKKSDIKITLNTYDRIKTILHYAIDKRVTTCNGQALREYYKTKYKYAHKKRISELKKRLAS